MFVEPSTPQCRDFGRSGHAIPGLRFFGGQGLAFVECWAGGAARRSRFTPAPRLQQNIGNGALLQKGVVK